MDQTTIALFTTVDSPLFPFLVGLALLCTILVMELISVMLIGHSIMGMDHDVDHDLDHDVETTDVQADIDAGMHLYDIGALTDRTGVPVALKWFEFGSVPLMVWIVSFLTGFSAIGIFIQFAVLIFTGSMMFGNVAAVIILLPALLETRTFTYFFAKFIPKTTTDVVSRKSLGGTIGVISIGTATASLPASAIVKDRHGAMHNIRVIPFRGEPDLSAGTEILVLRGPGPVYDAMSIQSASNY